MRRSRWEKLRSEKEEVRAQQKKFEEIESRLTLKERVSKWTLPWKEDQAAKSNGSSGEWESEVRYRSRVLSDVTEELQMLEQQLEETEKKLFGFLPRCVTFYPELREREQAWLAQRSLAEAKNVQESLIVL